MLTLASRRRLHVLAAGALALCGGAVAACADEASTEVLVLRPDSAVATYPDPSSELSLSVGRLSAVAVADGEIYVADQLAGRVYRFAEGTGFLNTLGRKGEGPGELQRPSEVEVGSAGDVWVADPPAGRVTRFRPGGDLVSTRRAPFGSMDFGLLPGDRMIVPSPTEGSLLAVVGPDDGITELAPGRESPGALASLAPEERLGFMATFLESDPGTGEVRFLVNRDDYSLWSLDVDERAGAVASPTSLPVPDWLAEALASERRAQEEGLREARLEFIPFNDMDMTSSGLWLTTGPVAAVGVHLPAGAGERPVLVRPAAEDDRFQGMLHATLASDRLYAVSATRVRVFALDDVGVRREPELP